MKALIIANQDRFEKYRPKDMAISQEVELVFRPRGSSDEDLLAAAWDADFIAADPMAAVSAALIRGMPNLKLIHSEGVAFNNFDLEAAREKGVYVCNCKGVNAGAVAEQTVLLMLAVLRRLVVGDRVERRGGQMQMKERTMVDGMKELSECKVGLVGFGDIGQAAAERLRPFGCELYYYTPRRKSEDMERRFGVCYLSLEELVRTCDIISLHTPVTGETKGMVNREFLSHMRPDAILINTARGELVDNEALREAIISGRIAGAGLDTVFPEPTTADNPLVDLPPEYADKVVFSPHIGGITTGAFTRAYRLIWQSFEDLRQGKRPRNIVNGL